jgi:hypothetical protein
MAAGKAVTRVPSEAEMPNLAIEHIAPRAAVLRGLRLAELTVERYFSCCKTFYNPFYRFLSRAFGGKDTF